jgi:hypothetical protein
MAFLTPLQINQLADAVGPRWEALIMTAAYTGLRWASSPGSGCPASTSRGGR